MTVLAILEFVRHCPEGGGVEVLKESQVVGVSKVANLTRELGRGGSDKGKSQNLRKRISQQVTEENRNKSYNPEGHAELFSLQGSMLQC